MKNKILIIIALLLAFEFVSANNISKVIVLDLTYDKGKININEYITKYGYYPDRKFQPNDGYILEIISDDNKVLYYSRFEVPNKFYTDITINNTNLSGGVIKLEKTNFAMVLPFFSNVKSIYIFNNENKTIASLKIEKEEKSMTKQLKNYIVVLIIIIILVTGIYYLQKKK